MPLVHLAARALPGTLLFHTWTEALALWRRLIDAFPDALGICVMPNHVHLLVPAEGARARLAGVMSGYARWRGHHRGERGDCWEPAPPPVGLADDDPKRVRRTLRYIHLNPCRGALAGDPLSWPLSTHRDAVGLGDPRRREREPGRFHEFVSADPTVSLVGTELPGLHRGAARLDEVEAAVGAVLRLQPREVRALAPARRLLLRAARVCEVDLDAIRDHLRLGRSQAFHLSRALPTSRDVDQEPLLYTVLRVVGDPRFAPLALSPRLDPTTWRGWRQADAR